MILESDALTMFVQQNRGGSKRGIVNLPQKEEMLEMFEMTHRTLLTSK